MERVGEIEWENGFPYYYQRCRVCGYAVRHFPPMKPLDGEPVSFLDTFQEALRRGVAVTAANI
jgi:hypothetical protein